MKCLRKYKWVKLHRACLPGGKGMMGYWAKLASRAAFRKGNGLYCGHKNPVKPGMWTGGIVGLKSILGVKRRQQALKIMCELESMGYLTFDLDLRTKKLSYQITDWVMACAGAECIEGAVYATEGYGFLCMPRSITDRLVFKNRTFDEADAWLDLWCHTIYRDRGNAFSFLGPTVQFGKYASVLTLEYLGRRWKWEKTKVWRFFKKYESVYSLYRLPGSFGCVIYNSRYILCGNVKLPEESDVVTLFHEIRAASRKGISARSSVERINRMVVWNSWKVIKAHEEAGENESGRSRVAPVRSYTRAYFSHGIVERILDVEDITNSGVYMNSMNFSLQVDSDFNWADSQAVTYFFTKSKTTYKGQLRIFPHEEKYFLTEPSEGQEQQSVFLLRHYLEAIKYLPQYDIRQMAPADQYIIQHREEGTPKDYERVITYTPDGAKEIEGWNIHLQIQPLHQDGDAYSGTGEEVIDVFYSSGYGRTTNPAVKWFDYTEDPSGMSYEQELKIQLDEFPGITFKYTPYDIIATNSWEDSNSVGKSYLISGLPIWNAYFCDLTGDGLPEICSQVSYGSGIIDNRVIIHDYANGASYSLIDRGYHDYYLRMNDTDGYLYVDKKVYNSDELVSSGRLVYKDNCLQIEGVITEPVGIPAPEQGFEGNLNLGLNAEIVEIDSMNQILYVKDMDDGADVFGDRCAVDCNYAISRYNLLYVNYGNPNDVRTIDFSTFEVGDAIIIGMYESEKEKAFNGSAIAEQVQLGTQKFTDENLIKKISNDLDLPTGCCISYIGEYSDGSDALLWFAIDGNYPDQYVAVECEKRSSGKYKFIDTYSPMNYAQDIVHVVWKAEDIFLVNNRDCSQIVYMNEAREVIREIDVAEYGLPYVFRLSMPSNPGICMFVDVNGEEIR